MCALGCCVRALYSVYRRSPVAGLCVVHTKDDGPPNSVSKVRARTARTAHTADDDPNKLSNESRPGKHKERMLASV